MPDGRVPVVVKKTGHRAVIVGEVAQTTRLVVVPVKVTVAVWVAHELD